MSVELLLADNEHLRKQIVNLKRRVQDLEESVRFYSQQRKLMKVTMHKLKEIMTQYTEKLHYQETTLIHSRTLRIDASTFQDMNQEVSLLKEQIQHLNRILDAKIHDSPKELEDIVHNISRMSSVISETHSKSTEEETAKETAEKQSLLLPPQKYRKQISWDPKTSEESPSPLYCPDSESEDNVFSSNHSDSSHSLEDGILGSANAGAIGLKTLQLFKRRMDENQGPESRKWYNRLRCCSFEECAIVIHLLYMHAIAIISITGVSFLVVGISLVFKPLMVAGTVMVISSYGLILNHCFYRGATPSKPRDQKMKVKAGDTFLDLNASVNETIDVDLTKPGRGEDILQDIGIGSSSNKGYL